MAALISANERLVSVVRRHGRVAVGGSMLCGIAMAELVAMIVHTVG
ncbi:MAG: hypothetical protein V4459_14500 [Pseudomonadota bacterium]